MQKMDWSEFGYVSRNKYNGSNWRLGVCAVKESSRSKARKWRGVADERAGKEASNMRSLDVGIPAKERHGYET